MQEGIIVTTHAYKRAKERLSYKKGVIEKMAEKAYFEGLGLNEVKGKLKKYINSEQEKFNNADNVRVVGEIVYLFAGNVLVTVFQIPNEYKKFVKICKKGR